MALSQVLNVYVTQMPLLYLLLFHRTTISRPSTPLKPNITILSTTRPNISPSLSPMCGKDVSLVVPEDGVIQVVNDESIILNVIIL